MTNALCRALQDKEEIQNVLIRYTRAADLPDEAIMRSVFHPDATDEHAGMFAGRMEDLIPRMTEMRKAFNVMQHALSNISIQLDGDAANSECYVHATQCFVKDGEQYHWLAGGRYVDRLERRNGEWRIVNRLTYIDWSRIVKIDPTLPKPL